MLICFALPHVSILWDPHLNVVHDADAHGRIYGRARSPGPRPPTIEGLPTKLLIFYFLLMNQLMTSLWMLYCNYQNCSVWYCVLKLCTVISTLRWAVLTVLWIWFCHTGPMSLCVLHICCIIVSTVGWTWWNWSLSLGPIFLQCIDTVGWVIWPIKTRPRYDL